MSHNPTGEHPITIYVSLLNEGVEVWRPVKATVRGNIYTIISKNTYPDDEHWQFAEGETVFCKPRTFADGKHGLVAYTQTEPPKI